MNVTYRLWPNGLAPRRIRMEIPGWAGEPTHELPQPWHCKPFVDGATYGLELLYPWKAECVVSTRADGTCEFSGEFRNEGPPEYPAEWRPFESFAPNHFGMATGVDIQTEDGCGMMILPHPRYYTDRTGTVPLAVCGLLEKDWWPHVFFLVFKAPLPGQQHVFRHGDPVASLLFLPKQVKYTLAEMTPEDVQARQRRENKICASWAEYSQRILYCRTGAAFDDKYKRLSQLARTEGIEQAQAAMDDPSKLPYHGTPPQVMDFRPKDESPPPV